MFIFVLLVFCFFFFKQKTAYEMLRSLVGSEMCIRDRLSGDYNPLHINEEYAKQTQFGSRIAHGPLVYGIAAGLLFQLHLYDDTLIAFLGFDSLKVNKKVKT